MASFTDIYTEFVSLCPIAISNKQFARELGANDYPPVYVWEPLQHQYDRPQQVGPWGPSMVSTMATPLFTKRVRLDLHCWGATVSDVEKLEQIAMTLLRSISKRNTAFIGSQWTQPLWATFGYVITVGCEFQLAQPKAAIVWPSSDASMPTALVEEIEFDQTSASPTDKILQVGEG